MITANNNLPILHIGYWKTGTTWFQKEFFQKIPNVEYYNHKRVIKTFGGVWQDFKTTDGKIELFKNSNKRLIISDESMIGSFKKIEQNACFYKQIFYPAQIVIFIRNQFDLYTSIYSQKIKEGSTLKFDKFLYPEDDLLYSGKIYCYDKIISLYKELFGKSNVFVYLYEEFSKDNSQFLYDFCLNHHINYDITQIRLKKQNNGFSIPLLNLKRISNYLTKINPDPKKVSKYIFHIPFWYEISYVVFILLNKIISNNRKLLMKEIIEPKKINSFIAFFANSNKRLITEHGLIKIKDYNYPL